MVIYVHLNLHAMIVDEMLYHHMRDIEQAEADCDLGMLQMQVLHQSMLCWERVGMCRLLEDLDGPRSNSSLTRRQTNLKTLPDKGPMAGKADCGRCQLGLDPEKFPDAVAKGDGGGS